MISEIDDWLDWGEDKKGENSHGGSISEQVIDGQLELSLAWISGKL